jgi:hypothetical protein
MFRKTTEMKDINLLFSYHKGVYFYKYSCLKQREVEKKIQYLGGKCSREEKLHDLTPLPRGCVDNCFEGIT